MMQYEESNGKTDGFKTYNYVRSGENVLKQCGSALQSLDMSLKDRDYFHPDCDGSYSV